MMLEMLNLNTSCEPLSKQLDRYSNTLSETVVCEKSLDNEAAGEAAASYTQTRAVRQGSRPPLAGRLSVAPAESVLGFSLFSGGPKRTSH